MPSDNNIFNFRVIKDLNTNMCQGKRSDNACPPEPEKGARNTKFDRTDRRITEGFLDYISSTPFADMTVAGLCRTAGVGRNTFYEHYPDLISVADACVRNLVSMTDFMPAQAGYPGWAHVTTGEPMCILLRRDRRYASLMFDPSLEDRCTMIVIEMSVPPTIRILMSRSFADEERLEAVCCTSVRGCLRSIKDNLDRTDEEWGRIKESIDTFNCGGLRLTCF